MNNGDFSDFLESSCTSRSARLRTVIPALYPLLLLLIFLIAFAGCGDGGGSESGGGITSCQIGVDSDGTCFSFGSIPLTSGSRLHLENVG